MKANEYNMKKAILKEHVTIVMNLTHHLIWVIDWQPWSIRKCEKVLKEQLKDDFFYLKYLADRFDKVSDKEIS